MAPLRGRQFYPAYRIQLYEAEGNGEDGDSTMDWFDTDWTNQLEMAGIVAIAAILGGVVGIEREIARKPAGLRTHAVLAAASALLVGLSDALVAHFVTESTPSLLRVDPIRVVEAIVTGVAFLGAGTIFRDRSKEMVNGLTTAASLLLVAGIGIAVAMGKLLLAALIALLSVAILHIAYLIVPDRK